MDVNLRGAVKKKAAHLSQEEEDALIKGIQDGAEWAFTRLYKDYFFSLAYYTDGIIKSWIDAEALVSETLEKVWLLRKRFTRLPDLIAFMFVTSRNASYDYLRANQTKQKRELLLSDLQVVPANSVENDETERAIIEMELLRKVHAEIEQLTPKRRQILDLFLNDLDTAEIATKMGLSEEAVRNAKFKAIRRLRDKLGNPYLFLFMLLLTEK